MRSTSLRLAPFSAIELPQLLLMAEMPVAWSQFLFELHQELAGREFPEKELVLKSLQLKFLTTNTHEGVIAGEEMLSRSSGKKALHVLDRAAFSDSWSGGRYVPIIRTTVAHLVQPVLGQAAADAIPAPDRPNKKTTIEFAQTVVEKIQPYASQLLGEQVWIFEKLKKIAGTDIPAKSKPDATSASEKPQRIASPTPQIPSDWNESARKIRHAKVHGKVNEISRHRGDNDWADVSPLKMLGYSVDAKEGLSDKDRMEFLVDFCENMILPLGLPKDYVEPWGDPGTKKRILKTAKHLAFVRRNFERQDLEKYARAIACWQRDFNFLQSNYKQMQINPMDWATAAKG